MKKSFFKFLIVWFGQFVSSIGSGLSAFALGIYVFEKTNMATSYSLLVLLAFLPSFILKPIGGVIADRQDRRLMMIIGDLGSILGLFFIIFMMFIGNEKLWIIYLGVTISSVFLALQNPAYKASLTDLLDEKYYSKGSGLMQLAESSKFIISPIIAVFLLTYYNIKTVLIIDVLTFLLAVIAVLYIKKNSNINIKKNENKNFLFDFKNGFKYTFLNKGILWLLIISSLITFAIGFLQALIVPMILGLTDYKNLGIIQTISATGMLVSSLLIGFFGKKKNHIKVLSYSLILAGIFYSLFGISTNIIFVVSVGFLFFFMLPFVNTSLDVLIRKNVINDMQGRVWSIISLISQLGMLFAFASAGLLADNIFNPLFEKEGLLASSVGKIIGVGSGRGIGFMFVLSGTIVFIVGIVISKLKVIRQLNKFY